MQPRGVLPFLYIAAGLFAAAQMTVQNTRPQQDLLQMQQVLGQVTAWICVQLAALLALALQVRAARSEHERFGYFAEPWELLEPASRFIVKEAARVAHMSDEELSRELERRHLPHQRGDRRGMEGALERDIAAVKAKEEQAAAREREERAARHKRFEKGRLAQTLMKEVLIKVRSLPRSLRRRVSANLRGGRRRPWRGRTAAAAATAWSRSKCPSSRCGCRAPRPSACRPNRGLRTSPS
jgi:hypothetical protein